MGNTPINRIKEKNVLAECIFRFAIRKGLIENDPTPHLGEALKPRKVKPMARLDISEFSPFLERMDRYHGNPMIKTAIQLMTFVRTAELRMMEWDENNFETKIMAHTS